MTPTVTIPCQANPLHAATEGVEVEADGKITPLILCRPCRIEMELARLPGVAIRVVRAFSSPVRRIQPTPPPAPIVAPKPIPNEYGLTRSAWRLLCMWQASPRTVHTLESAAEELAREKSVAARSIRELRAIGFVRHVKGRSAKAPQMYTLTQKGARA